MAEARVQSAQAAVDSAKAQLRQIGQAAREALRLAGVQPGQVGVVYFTGGSTGFDPLVQHIAAQMPAAGVIHGDRHASVATGLGVYAKRLYGQDRQGA